MQTIPLTHGLFALVDDADFTWLSQWKWCAHQTKQGRWYATRIERSAGKPKIVRMHRQILNAPPGVQGDHKNGLTLDNQRSNLRLATCGQNCQNRGKQKRRTTSQYKGVSWSATHQAWRASICDGKARFLGRFKTETDAAKAYNTAARTLFGEFAKLNAISERIQAESTGGD